MSITPLKRAEESSRIMFAEDTAARHLGIEIIEVGPGYAKLSMVVRPEMSNGLGVCHGGYIFTLADTAFAYSCNSYNQRAVAAGAAIEFVAPGFANDVLVAEAHEQHRAGRSGVYDVRVTRANGTTVAVFRGKSATIKGQFFEENAS